jgi:hypothetical protein
MVDLSIVFVNVYQRVTGLMEDGFMEDTSN